MQLKNWVDALVVLAALEQAELGTLMYHHAYWQSVSAPSGFVVCERSHASGMRLTRLFARFHISCCLGPYRQTCVALLPLGHHTSPVGDVTRHKC